MIFHIITPDTLLAFKFFVDVFNDFCEESAGTRGGIEDLNLMHFLFN